MFSFGVPPGEILSGFRGGRFSLAADLFPEDVEALRRQSADAYYTETPGLSTYYAAFNVHRGPTKDREFRRKLVQAVNVVDIVRRTMGQVAIPAQGWIPPGLLGYEAGRGRGDATLSGQAPERLSRAVELSAAVHPIYTTEYSGFFDSFLGALQKLGVKVKVVTKTMGEFIEATRHVDLDLVLARWFADYPDVDTFAYQLHTTGFFASGSPTGLGKLCGSSEADRTRRRV